MRKKRTVHDHTHARNIDLDHLLYPVKRVV